MIKLVITSDSTPSQTQSFENFPIIIGGKLSPLANLKLDIPDLNDNHLQIVSQKNDEFKKDAKPGYYIINNANDPFCTLNGLSFGKQPIEHNDLIQIFDTSIQFEIESAVDMKNYSKIQIPSEEQEKNNFSIKKAAIAPSINASSLKNQAPLEHKSSLKDYYLSEYDDENQQAVNLNEQNDKSDLTKKLSTRLSFFLLIATSLTFLISGFGVFAYFWLSDQSDGEEIKAARGVADVAMALAYAGLKNIQPQNQNLSYHEFLKNNLYAIIEPNSNPAAEFDSHGQFSNCPYMLRIHTNSDLSECIVIAQPAPSLLQWILPKASIVIDSQSMELRKIKDIKAINRLIANSNNLDESSGHEISSLVKQGVLIELSRLANTDEYASFNPPKMLELLRKGAENLVYNAPRYYLLGEAILETSINILDHYTAPGDMQILKQELNSLMQYPNLILYSSEGIQNAIESQKALAAIAPKDNFLIGYLKFNPKGKIIGAELLSDNATTDVVISDQVDKEIEAAYEEDFEGQFLPSASFNNKNDEQKEHDSNKRVDTSDPLFLHLTAMTANRSHTLKPISDEMIDLIKKDLSSPQIDFSSKMAKLQKKYVSLNKEEISKLEKKFDTISNEYSHLPASLLIEYINEANVADAFKNYLNKKNSDLNSKPMSDDLLQAEIKKIEKSFTWQELENAAIQANLLLRFENIPDYKKLISYQNSVRLGVTQKLNHFILSSDSSLSNKDFSSEYLQSLSNILKNSWIIDPETYNFYIDEFELREPQLQP